MSEFGDYCEDGKGKSDKCQMSLRLRTRGEGAISLSIMGVVLLRVDLEPIRMSSVLSLFSLRNL